MSDTLFVSQADGSVLFTDAGNAVSYYQTLQRLLHHYMKSGLKYPPEKINSLLQQFKTFAHDHFINLDDYLEKLPDVANLIGETDVSRFSIFVGKNFATVLEDVKTKMQNDTTLVENTKVIAYGMPSKSMMATFRTLFAKAPALVWPPDSGEPKIASFDLHSNASDDSRTAVAGKTVAPITPKPAAVFLTPKQKFGTLPSRHLVKLFLKDFKSSPPLAWSSSQNTVEDESQNQTNVPEAEESEIQDTTTVETSSFTVSNNVALSAGQKSSTMTGREILRLYGKLFRNSKPLQFATEVPADGASISSETADTISVNKAVAKKNFTLKEFALVVQKLSHFRKTKDQDGYGEWYKSLNLSYKVFLRLYNLQASADKGADVNWTGELKALQQKTFIDMQDLQIYLQELRSFRRVLSKIQEAMRAGIRSGGDAKSIQSSYAALINIFENNESIGAKTMLLKMHLLSLQPPAAKQAMSDILLPLLEELKTLYSLPE